MKVIIFGAAGIVGHGVLRECLLDSGINEILSLGRTSTGVLDDKLRERLLADFADYSAVESELAGYDACFACLGVSSAGMSESEYRRITYNFTLAAAANGPRISTADSPASVWVIPTNEELMIAQHTHAFIFPQIEASVSQRKGRHDRC